MYVEPVWMRMVDFLEMDGTDIQYSILSLVAWLISCFLFGIGVYVIWNCLCGCKKRSVDKQHHAATDDSERNSLLSSTFGIEVDERPDLHFGHYDTNDHQYDTVSTVSSGNRDEVILQFTNTNPKPQYHTKHLIEQLGKITGFERRVRKKQITKVRENRCDIKFHLYVADILKSGGMKTAMKFIQDQDGIRQLDLIQMNKSIDLDEEQEFVQLSFIVQDEKPKEYADYILYRLMDTMDGFAEAVHQKEMNVIGENEAKVNIILRHHGGDLENHKEALVFLQNNAHITNVDVEPFDPELRQIADITPANMANDQDEDNQVSIAIIDESESEQKRENNDEVNDEIKNSGGEHMPENEGIILITFKTKCEESAIEYTEVLMERLSAISEFSRRIQSTEIEYNDNDREGNVQVVLQHFGDDVLDSEYMEILQNEEEVDDIKVEEYEYDESQSPTDSKRWTL